VRILSRYLLARFVASFIMTMIVIFAMIAIAEMLIHIEDILEQEGWLAGTTQYLGLKLPAVYLPTVVPIAAFSAAFACIGLAARWQETIAMKAAGISPIRAAAPVLLAAALLSGLTFLVNETLVLGATRAWDRFERGGDDTRIVFRSGSFWYHRGNIIYNVRFADPGANTWRGVTLFELNDRGRLTRTIQSAHVQIEDDQHWRFLDGTIRSFDPDDPRAAPSFEKFSEKRLRIEGGADSALREADASHLSLPELREYIDARSREGEDVTGAKGLLHTRLTDPLTVLLFAGLAIPLGIRVEDSKGFAIPALLGVLVVAAFVFSRTVGAALIQQRIASPVATHWLILLAFCAYAAWRFSRIPR
jgi:LPS export ABC transporter permease LptG